MIIIINIIRIHIIFFCFSSFKRCTLRFPSTDLYISFSSLLNNHNSINRISSENILRHISIDTSQRYLSSSIPMDTTFQSVPQQQVILVTTQSNNNLQPLSINISNSSSSPLSNDNSTEQIKSQHESPIPTINHSFLG
jgi:hypothetical protein